MGILKEERIGGQRLILGDCLEVMPLLGKVDAVVTDPPYGIGIDKFDVKIDTHRLGQIIHQVMADNAWYSFFGQMPSILDFYSDTKAAGLSFYEHIIWVKRIQTALACPINRTHESIFIFKKGKPKIYQKRGPYSDVRVEMLYTMPEYIQGIKTTLSHLRSTGGYGRKVPLSKHKHKSHTGGFEGISGAEFVNFTNVWSFLPQNNASKADGPRIEHATVKPTKMLERLLTLLSGEEQEILDPFMGSGTTLVACQRLGRQGIGIELDPDYFDIACRRVDQATRQPDLFIAPAPPAPVQEGLAL